MKTNYSKIELIALLPKTKRDKFINSLSKKDKHKFLHSWKYIARPEQLEPEGDWHTWLIRSGRGWGKTRTGAEWVLKRVREGHKRIAIIGQTKADVRDTMIELGDSSILNITNKEERPEYEPSKRRLIFKTGAIGIIYSGDEPDQLRGPQHDSAWVDELAKFQYPQEIWDNLEMGLRLGNNPKVVVTTTPRPIKLIKELIKDNKTINIQGNTFDNKLNLSPIFIDRMLKKYEGTRLGRQELKGEILEDVVGALWTTELIEQNRVREKPALIRIVIGIDPAVSNTDESAETGIVVAGIDANGIGYVLDDLSLQASPNVWSAKAISGYYNHKADRIIAEINNGGDLVETVIKTSDKNISYKGVHASRGKITRAEPISALYEQGKIKHIRVFPELEDQMCNWVIGEKSPDRLDALVWAFTELMLNEGMGNVRFI